MAAYGVDTSAAIPLLTPGHPRHAALVHWSQDHELLLAGHAAVETFSVLTRMPSPLRLTGADAAAAIASRFSVVAVEREADVVARIAARGVTGGAVYDALVALAAVDAGLVLATADARAIPTYARMGARVEIVA